MTFLNVILLGGLAAASIPIIIHFFNRHRFRVVKWGAMHLLDAAFRTNRRRLRLEQLILLLVRCLVPALLALCMARPVLTGALQLMGAAKTSLVVLLDNSYSMDAGSGTSAFAQARENTARIIEDLARGSDVSVVLTAGGVSTLLESPTFDTGRVNQELAKLDAGYGRAAFPEALEATGNIFSKMGHSHREVVVLTDFQRISCSEKEAGARARALEAFKQMPLPPHVTLFHVGAEVKDNVSVESLDYSRVVLGVGQPMQLRANLRNWGERDYPDLRVYFRVDGKERSASQISLGAGEQRQVLFSHTFDTAGSHVVEVFADADALKADNSLQASIPVWDRVPVLLVNGDPSKEPLKGETDFLDIALQPFGQAKKADLTDLIITRVVTAEARELTPDAIAKSRVIVLANVRQLTDAQVRALKHFVYEGGGLLIFPGNRINPQWYNTTLADNEGLLPMPLTTLAGGIEDNAPRAKIVAEHFNHPALEIFNDPRSGNLADGEIKLWYKTKAPALGGDSPVSVMARLDSGDPFLIERKVGEGRVIQCTTPCDADWGNLPVRPFYLPLMQRLVTYLASTVYPPRNVEVGKPIAAFLDKPAAGRKATFTDPAGNRHDATITTRGTRSYVEFAQTQRPGLYLLTAPDDSVIHFVVHTTREESNLQQLNRAEQESLAKAMDATLVHSLKEYKERDQGRRFGRELWRSLLWALLALIFVELFLQQWFARRRTSAPQKIPRPAEVVK
ncbi:MAG: BatA domain-containing protein [Verrucomicrobia bacterium]|nr:BatA domain-containing protein [Verrucomicrobiota bacterium]